MNSKQYRYNPELTVPQGSINCNRNNPLIALREKRMIVQHRKLVEEYLPPDGICRIKEYFESADGKSVPFYIIEKSAEQKRSVPCIVYFHGGGFMMPLQAMMLQNAAYYTAWTGYKVFLPEYRYAPKAACKTNLEDCFYMILHIIKNAQDYGVNTEKLLIYGDSAGGALAAGITHLMRDRGLPAAAGQILIYPALDNHSEKYPSIEEFQYAVWPNKSNAFMWKYYLRGAPPAILPYAAPMNMDRFDGLPPAYVEPQEMDILRDEGIAYAEKLERAGIRTELNVIPGSYHGFDADHASPLVRQVLAHRCEVMRELSNGESQG